MRSGRRLRRALGAAVLLIGTLAAGCGGSATPAAPTTAAGSGRRSAAPLAKASKPATPLKPFNVVLDWDGTAPQEMGIWIALDKGWFKQAGLDVHVHPSVGANLAVQLLGSGRANAAVATASAVVLAAARGVPIKMVAVYTQKDPNAFRYFKESGIRGPKDFEGKRLGLVPGSIQQLLWKRYAKAAGIDARKVKIVNVSTKTFTQDLISGKVDISDGALGSPGDFIVEQKTHKQVVDALISDYLPLVGYGLAVRTDALSSPASKAFVQAVVRAWRYMYTDPKAALAYGAAQVRLHVPTAPSATILEEAGRAMLTLVRTPATQGHPFGWAPQGLWRQTLHSLNTSGSLTVSDVFDTSLLPSGSGG